VFVDEAQFFAPTWLRLVRKAVRPRSGQLFLAADPTQGFLKRRQSWISSGLNVRGHSARLLRCYRNTQEILGFACAFYRHRLPEEEEEVNLPGLDELDGLETGEAPQLLHVDSPQGERARVANEIAAAVRSGANPEHFLVIQSDSAMVTPFIQTLDGCCGKPIGRDLKDYDASAAPGRVKVSALNAATGLESPVVFLCGLDSLLEREGGLQLDPDQQSELTRDNTRRIYMGMTRASQKLLITHRRSATRALLEPKVSPLDGRRAIC
jgi:superfamily I DNA/RNA helicase